MSWGKISRTTDHLALQQELQILPDTCSSDGFSKEKPLPKQMMRHSHWVPFRPKAESKGFSSRQGGMALCHRIAIITRVFVQTELFSIHLPTLEGLNPPPHDHLFSCCTPAKEDGHYSSTILSLNHEYGWCFPPASLFWGPHLLIYVAFQYHCSEYAHE